MVKKLFVFALTVFLLAAAGCHPNAIDSTGYTIVDATNASLDNKSSVDYPQISTPDNAYAAVNALIYSEADELLQDAQAGAVVNIGYSVTLANDTYISVLFEGTVVASGAAHPTNIIRAVTVSLQEKQPVTPLTTETVDEAFIAQFKAQLPASREEERFTDQEWQDIITYFQGLSDEDLRHMILDGETALTQDGVLIGIDVPHAVGDYIKVSVKGERGF